MCSEIALRRAFLLLALLVASTDACSRNAAQDEHLVRGDSLARQQRFSEAIVEYRQARANGGNARASQQLGNAYLHLGEVSLAYDAFLKAVDLNPANQVARRALATIDLLSSRREQARDQAYALLERDSGDISAMILLGASASSPDEIDRAIMQLKTAEPRFGRDSRARLTLGTLYWRKRDTLAARGMLEQAASDSSIPEAHLVLSRFYSSQRNSALAERELKKADGIVESESPTRFAVERLVALGQRDQANTLLREVADKHPADPYAWRILANMALSDGNEAEAASFVGHFAAADSSDVEAIVLRGRLHLARREYDAAIADFRRAATVAPDLAPAHYYLGTALLLLGKSDDAKKELQSAVALSPNYADAVFQLTELHLRTNQADAARSTVERFIETNPKSVKAHVLLGAALAAIGHASEASEAFRQILQIEPKSAEGHYWLGMGLMGERRVEEARAEFETALTLSPGFREPITQLVLLDVAGGKSDAALDRLHRQMAVVKGSADLYDLLGIVHAARNQVDSSESSFIKSIELNSRLLDPRVRLAELYVSTGRFEKALTSAEAARAIEPNNLRALMAVGVAAQQKGDTARARQAYEAALAVNPRFSAAANNLAMLLLDRGDDAGALKYAVRAQEAAPDDPHVADTLGWILFRRGEFDRALKMLKESAAKLPESPSVQYHLGVAAQKTGDTALARQALGRAVNSTTSFADRENARRALVGLR